MADNIARRTVPSPGVDPHPARSRIATADRPDKNRGPAPRPQAQSRPASQRGLTPRPRKKSFVEAAAGLRAGFFGRRNTEGAIVPLTETDIKLPREPWIKPALTVALAAVGSFAVVALILWLTSPNSGQDEPTNPPPRASTGTSNEGPPIEPRPAPPTARPALAASPQQAPASDQMSEAIAPTPSASADLPDDLEKTPPQSIGRQKARKNARETRRGIDKSHQRKRQLDPDAPLVPTLF